MIRSVPPGATLTDKTGTVLGTAPTRIRVPTSGMDIEASLRGYQTAATRLTGSRRQRNILIRLTPIRGTAKISVAPPEAKVTLDDKPIGGTPPYQVSGLAAGSHVVTATLAGYDMDERLFEVVSSSPVSVALELKPATAPLDDTAVEATGQGKPRAGAADRRKQTQAAQKVAEGKASPGDTAKASSVPTGPEQPKTAGSKVAVQHPAPPSSTTKTSQSSRAGSKGTGPGETGASGQEPGFLTLNAFPYAFVEIDGVRVKTTPLFNHALPPGPHKVTLKTEDGRTKTLDIVIEPGTTFKKIVRFNTSP